MRYYSDELKQFFNTEQECSTAEAKAKEAREKEDHYMQSLFDKYDDVKARWGEAREQLREARNTAQKWQDELDTKKAEFLKPYKEAEAGVAREYKEIEQKLLKANAEQCTAILPFWWLM